MRHMKWIVPALVLGMVFVYSQVRAEEAKATGTITGTVKAGDKAAGDVTVRLMQPQKQGEHGGRGGDHKAEGEAPKGGPKSIAETKTAADGTFKFENVAVGEYVVGAMSKELGAGKANVTVTAGGTANVDITLTKRANTKEGAAK